VSVWRTSAEHAR